MHFSSFWDFLTTPFPTLLDGDICYLKPVRHLDKALNKLIVSHNESCHSDALEGTAAVVQALLCSPVFLLCIPKFRSH